MEKKKRRKRGNLESFVRNRLGLCTFYWSGNVSERLVKGTVQPFQV